MVRRPEEPAAPATVRPRWRFAVVLAAALLLAVAQPLLSGLLNDEGSFDFFFSVLIVAVLLMVFEEKEHRRVAVSLSLVAFLGIWIGHVVGGAAGQVLLVGGHLLAAGFFAFALYGILHAILVKQASGRAILGVVCGYLLLGIIWSLVFFALETASPGSFAASASGRAEGASAALSRSDLGYFSFITLATVGYGDITPVSPLARTLAWTEAITGQFYLAILVAGLVGLKVTQALKD